MNIAIINGPNLNLVGTREQDIYGELSLTQYLEDLIKQHPEHSIRIFQSNIEGEIIDVIQAQQLADAIIINAGAYTHTSIAIADALKAVQPKTMVEVHLSNVMAREEYRHVSFISPVCNGVISGFGLHSYLLALQYILKILNKNR